MSLGLNKEKMVLHLSSFFPATWERSFLAVSNFRWWKRSEGTTCTGLSEINCDDSFFFYEIFWKLVASIKWDCLKTTLTQETPDKCCFDKSLIEFPSPCFLCITLCCWPQTSKNVLTAPALPSSLPTSLWLLVVLFWGALFHLLIL